ncbi:MAG: hypothetical protein E7467_07920 [Ruminococcaceae bacterium]|nr:hypothetical protein [Oscillospiraceae bacterium]
MLDKLYITPRQWLHILRWTLYALIFLLAMMLQTVVLADRPIFGIVPDFIPIVITCVCMREGPQSGGWFALWTSLFWFLSGADSGSITIAVLTVLPIMCSILCRSLLTNRFLTVFLMTAATHFTLHCIIFVFKYLTSAMHPSLFIQKLLPCVALSMLTQPLFYWLVKKIHQIGDPYEST